MLHAGYRRQAPHVNSQLHNSLRCSACDAQISGWPDRVSIESAYRILRGHSSYQQPGRMIASTGERNDTHPKQASNPPHNLHDDASYSTFRQAQLHRSRAFPHGSCESRQTSPQNSALSNFAKLREDQLRHRYIRLTTLPGFPCRRLDGRSGPGLINAWSAPHCNVSLPKSRLASRLIMLRGRKSPYHFSEKMDSHCAACLNLVAYLSLTAMSQP